MQVVIGFCLQRKAIINSMTNDFYIACDLECDNTLTIR